MIALTRSRDAGFLEHDTLLVTRIEMDMKSFHLPQSSLFQCAEGERWMATIPISLSLDQFVAPFVILDDARGSHMALSEPIQSLGGRVDLIVVLAAGEGDPL